jgi:hypothetical protein
MMVSLPLRGVLGSGFRVQRFRVQGFWVQRFRVQKLPLRGVPGSRFKIQGSPKGILLEFFGLGRPV